MYDCVFLVFSVWCVCTLFESLFVSAVIIGHVCDMLMYRNTRTGYL